MTKRQQIEQSIEKQAKLYNFIAPFGYTPTLGFKLSNVNNESLESIQVASLNEAEDLAISFISTLKKGEIFIDNIFSEDKELFLRVKFILPE